MMEDDIEMSFIPFEEKIKLGLDVDDYIVYKNNIPIFVVSDRHHAIEIKKKQS